MSNTSSTLSQGSTTVTLHGQADLIWVHCPWHNAKKWSFNIFFCFLSVLFFHGFVNSAWVMEIVDRHFRSSIYWEKLKTIGVFGQRNNVYSINSFNVSGLQSFWDCLFLCFHVQPRPVLFLSPPLFFFLFVVNELSTSLSASFYISLFICWLTSLSLIRLFSVCMCMCTCACMRACMRACVCVCVCVCVRVCGEKGGGFCSFACTYFLIIPIKYNRKSLSFYSNYWECHDKIYLWH